MKITDSWQEITVYILSCWCSSLWLKCYIVLLYQITIPPIIGNYVLFVYVPVKPYNITCIIQGNKYTPLHYAATNNHTDVTALLVDHGANVNMKNKVG